MKYLKTIILMTILFGLTPSLFAQELADVQVKGSWITVYDAKGKKISSMSSSGREVKGVGSDFFVVLEGAWIKTYDAKCKRIASMSASGKEIRGASGSSFTVKEGAWIKTYDRNCKKTGSRSAK